MFPEGCEAQRLTYYEPLIKRKRRTDLQFQNEWVIAFREQAVFTSHFLSVQQVSTETPLKPCMTAPNDGD